MTIELITGLPGNGKTLYGISYVKEWAERQNRPVYYSGIKDLMLPWTEIEPEKWFDCPANSIIVIDECQRVFRPRTMGKEPPEHVSRLETHRHQGLDIVLITQHPLLADSAIRRLVGKHMHVIRTFGTERATVHEWGSVKDTCDKSSGRTDSIKHLFKYPKEAFGFYKSAEVHTVKRNIPMKVLMIPVLIALLIVSAYVVKRYISKSADKANQEQISETKIPSNSVNQVEKGKGVASYKNALDEAKQYVYVATARVEGLPHTAPKYDELTTPTVAPVPAGCVKSESKGCKCFSQQATPIDMPKEMCENIVKHGWFEDFDVAGKAKKQEEQKQKSDSSKLAKNDLEPARKSQIVSFENPQTPRQISTPSSNQSQGKS